jgi:hypothetical protein
MNTIATDRLYSDPRLKRLGRELGCPAKALGILMWMWHGTQNLGLAVCSECDILDTFPQGLRTPQKVVAALVRCGWLEDLGGSYRVVGNSEHVQAREKMSEGGRAGALKRWGKEHSPPHPDPIPQDIAGPSEGHGVKMLSLPPSLPPDPKEEREEPPAPKFSRLGSRHPEVTGFEARYLELFPGTLALDDKGRARAAEVIRKLAENGKQWAPVLEAYADPRWAFANGSLDWLRDHLPEVVFWIAKGKPPRAAAAAKPFAQLGNGDQQKRENRPDAEATRKRLEREERERQRVDPEQAKQAVAGILAKLR